MIIKDKYVTLKDGRTALICSPREEHIDSMLDYLVISAHETEFIMRYPEECGDYTYDKERDWIESCNKSDNIAVLICVVDGKVAGNCHIEFGSKIKISHRATIGIALISEFWNLGIGSALFDELIRIAEEREGILQLELEFVEGNTRARHLYEKKGFRIVGVIPNAIRLKNGTLLNEYKMIKEMK